MRFPRVDGEGFSFLLRPSVEKCNAVLEVEKITRLKVCRSWGKKQYCGLKAHRSERHRTRALQENQWWNRRKFDIFDFQNNTHKIRASTAEAEIREDQQKKKVW